MTFILAEDEALHLMLRGMTVSDPKNAERAVGVWFGQPDPELQAQAYPYVTIDLIDISEAPDRVMAGMAKPWYFEQELGISEDAADWEIYMPTPVNLDYQITTYARQPRHDRQILSQILGPRLPLRFGSLQVFVSEETDDEDTLVNYTVRRLDVLDIAKRDMPEAGKRLFMNAFTVRVSSEILGPFSPKEYMQVRQVNLKTYMQEPYPMQPTLDMEHTIGTP